MNKTKKLSALVIDDETPALEQLSILLNESEQIEIKGKLNSTKNALCFIEEHSPDVLFLDIQMPHQSGIDFLKTLSQHENSPHVVMVTAYHDYMLEAFRNNAFDYLLKPIDRKELNVCIERLANKPNGKIKQDLTKLLMQLNNKITVPGVYETHFINTDNILYLQADGRYADIQLTCGKTIKTCRNLGVLFNEMKHKNFIRISRSCVINTNYLVKLNTGNKTLLLEANGTSKEVSFSIRYLK
jgi:two-component system, LytTR family, response regulator